MTGRLFAPENFQSKRVKIAGKRWKRKVCEQKADESCWWVTWMGDRRLRLSCPQNSFGSKNLDFLSPKVRRLPEFEFLVLKTQRMDALSQTQSNVSFLDTCKIAKNKTLRSLAPFKDLLRFLIIKTAGTLRVADNKVWAHNCSSASLLIFSSLICWIFCVNRKSWGNLIRKSLTHRLYRALC